jgi:hypothetical protein
MEMIIEIVSIFFVILRPQIHKRAHLSNLQIINI